MEKNKFQNSLNQNDSFVQIGPVASSTPGPANEDVLLGFYGAETLPRARRLLPPQPNQSPVRPHDEAV
jgi:hypothetical protein